MTRALRHLVPAAVLLLAAVAPALPAALEGGPPATAAAPAAPRLIVYTFHGQYRCWTCLKVEEYARDTVNEHFADEVKSGLVAFRVVDISRPENQHFIADYGLTSWSVVLSLRENGAESRHRNLADIKGFVKDRQAFIEHLFREMASFLREP